MSPGGLRITRDGAALRWRAWATDGAAGALLAFARPDNRCFVRFRDCRAGAAEPLLAVASDELASDLYATVDPADHDRLAHFAALGFILNRTEGTYAVPTDPTVTGLAGVELPASLATVPADAVPEDELRGLDDTLRQDLPGCDGWQWDAAGFREETYDPEVFDPELYLVVVEREAGGYAGLVRVWNRSDGPRFGFIGVTRPYRRSGVGRALLGRVLGVLHSRGVVEVTAGIDDTNAASRALFAGVGARRIGELVELVRRRAAAV